MHYPFSKYAIAVLLCVAGCDGAPKDDLTPSISIEEVDGAFVIMARGGVAAGAIDGDLSQSEWRDIMPIHVAGSDGAAPDALPNVLGEYRADENGIVFVPQFPLSREIQYRVQYGSHEEILSLPPEPDVDATRVVQVYPTSDVLPANLLKFYVQFSAPMSRGHRYDFVRIMDEEGNEVVDPFPRIGVELWDANQEQFTLLLDPGRIKRGIAINESMGLPLVPGKTYRMVIDGDWRDAAGAPLAEEFVKEFRVVDPDHLSPQYTDWNVSTPNVGSSDPVVIGFGESLDYALADRFIWIEDERGSTVAGDVTLTENEGRWAFTLSSESWPQGDYAIRIHSRLEDLAGNQIEKLFEVDAQSESTEEGIQIYSIPFAIR